MAEQKRDLSISFVRMLAMMFIVICHVMQYYDVELAWWFNIGVQIFLCISGYLYGRKRILDILVFYRKNFVKILIDYEIVVFAAVAATVLFTDTVITVEEIAEAVLTVSTIAGGAHLWFIPTILMCYLLTPLYERIFSRAEQSHKLLVLAAAVLLFVVNELVFRQMFSYFNAAWINCYLIGFALRRFQQYRFWYTGSAWLLTLTGAVFISIQASVRYLQLITLTDAWRPFYYPMCDYGHVFLGVALFCSGRVLLRPFCNINLIQRILRLSDRYSYQIYLTHHFFILGPLSLMALTANSYVNVVLILLLTVLTAVLLQKISAKISAVFMKKQLRNQ